MRNIKYASMEKIEKSAYHTGYRVTKDGQLVSFTGRKLKCFLNSSGYYVETIRNPNKLNKGLVQLRVHRLQAYQKFGDRIYKEGMVVRHLNGISTDNSWNNIAIGTCRDNSLDIPSEKRISMSRYAAKFMPLRYSHERIFHIKEDRQKGMSYSELMRKYNISSKGTISYICNHNYDNS